jgi:hypothetical protein
VYASDTEEQPISISEFLTFKDMPSAYTARVEELAN